MEASGASGARRSSVSRSRGRTIQGRFFLNPKLGEAEAGSSVSTYGSRKKKSKRGKRTHERGERENSRPPTLCTGATRLLGSLYLSLWPLEQSDPKPQPGRASSKPNRLAGGVGGSRRPPPPPGLCRRARRHRPLPAWRAMTGSEARPRAPCSRVVRPPLLSQTSAGGSTKLQVLNERGLEDSDARSRVLRFSVE